VTAASATSAFRGARVVMKVTATPAWNSARAVTPSTAKDVSMTKKDVPIAMINQTKKSAKKQKATMPLPPASLRFSPTAWAKLLFLRDYGDTEVGGFGISAHDDLLLIEDVQLVKQVCTWAHVAFDDQSVADFIDEQVDAGRHPEQCGRIWVHTHPGDCPRPSMTDEQTFTSAFGSSNWAIMFIVARGGDKFAKIRFNVGPRAEFEIPVGIDYATPFAGCEFDEWADEYLAHVRCEHMEPAVKRQRKLLQEPVSEQALLDDWYESWREYIEEPEEMRGLAL